MTDDTEAKPKGNTNPITKQVKDLAKQVDTLQAVIAEISHFTGTNRILDKYQIERWEPGRNDMRKYKD